MVFERHICFLILCDFFGYWFNLCINEQKEMDGERKGYISSILATNRFVRGHHDIHHARFLDSKYTLYSLFGYCAYACYADEKYGKIGQPSNRLFFCSI